METKHQKIYLTTGEFAKLCHTTKHTLFHYCDIDLFSPTYTDENGYRYYHVLQYDTFMTISEMRAIGMPLKEIKEYLAERSTEHMLELYQKQERLINQQITKLEKIKTQVHRQIEAIHRVIECEQNYFVEAQEQMYLSCSEWITQRDDYTMASAIGALRAGNTVDAPMLCSGMISKRDDLADSDHYPFCFYVGAATKQSSSAHIKQAGSYLCTYHYGDYQSMCSTFRKLIEYADQQRIELDDWLYAETMIGDWAVTRPQEYIIKISVRVIGKVTEK